MSYLSDMKIDLVDMITDWVSEQGQNICTLCDDNQEESDIGYTRCPADFDLFDCPNTAYDLRETIRKAVDDIIEAIPSPTEYD